MTLLWDRPLLVLRWENLIVTGWEKEHNGRQRIDKKRLRRAVRVIIIGFNYYFSHLLTQRFLIYYMNFRYCEKP